VPARTVEAVQGLETVEAAGVRSYRRTNRARTGRPPRHRRQLRRGAPVCGAGRCCCGTSVVAVAGSGRWRPSAAMGEIRQGSRSGFTICRRSALCAERRREPALTMSPTWRGRAPPRSAHSGRRSARPACVTPAGCVSCSPRDARMLGTHARRPRAGRLTRRRAQPRRDARERAQALTSYAVARRLLRCRTNRRSTSTALRHCRRAKFR